MATVALNALETAVADGTTYVSWNGQVSSVDKPAVKAFLASDFDADDVVRFENTGATGSIEVCDSYGRRIGFVGPEKSAVAILTDAGEWQWAELHVSPAALVANGSDATTTQTLANALKAILVNLGYMKAE